MSKFKVFIDFRAMTPDLFIVLKNLIIQLTAQAIMVAAARRTAADMATWDAFSSPEAGPP